jgi:pyridoxine 5-phosphate synthase
MQTASSQEFPCQAPVNPNPRAVRYLSVNIDHVATLRQARQEDFPDPVQSAVLAELGGADGITVHLRQDRRHITERDVELLKRTIKSDLNLELAAVPAMTRVALRVQPAQVTLVPEAPGEVTTRGGLDLTRNPARLAGVVRRLRNTGIRVSAFVESSPDQIEAASRLGCAVVELNTDLYSRQFRAGKSSSELARITRAARLAARLGLRVHAGHGIDYRNIVPLLSVPEVEGYSIGFSVVARALSVGLRDAVLDMKRIMEVYS